MNMFNQKSDGRKILDIFVALALYLMVTLVFINVILRYFLNSGWPVSEELSRWLFVWVSVFGSIVAFKENKHVGVNLLIDYVSPFVRKKLIILGDIVVLIVLLILTWGSFLYLKNNYFVPASASHLPTGILSSSLVVCSLSMFVINTINLIKHIKTQDNNNICNKELEKTNDSKEE